VTIRVLIVDDHRIVREGLRLVLSGYPDIRVVGEAVDGHDALVQAAEFSPDVVLLDIFMPVMDGIVAARRLRDERPNVRVVILTMDDDANDVRRLLDADIAGYVMKDAPSSEVVRAIRSAVRGEPVLDEVVARALLTDHRRARRDAGGAAMFDLTERERQILCRLAVGESNKEIARALDLAEKTIRNHLHNVFRKMAVADRTQAVILALRYRLCADGPRGIVARHGDNRFDQPG